jgi:hypothetical protein
MGKHANRSPPPFPDHNAMPRQLKSLLDEYSQVNQTFLMLCDLVPAAIRQPPPPRLHRKQDPGCLRQRILALQTAIRTLQNFISDKKPSQEAELRRELAQDPLPAVVQHRDPGKLPPHLRIPLGPTAAAPASNHAVRATRTAANPSNSFRGHRSASSNTIVAVSALSVLPGFQEPPHTLSTPKPTLNQLPRDPVEAICATDGSAKEETVRIHYLLGYMC